ncbi:hypothetical protein DL95DRAFT_449097 [Leptodontidium sp. 2 PMI_412]|nr:hypothetical protein DL95DRAFT_449097 [Leptodontidium sp. 2 PMI_412]
MSTLAKLDSHDTRRKLSGRRARSERERIARNNTTRRTKQQRQRQRRGEGRGGSQIRPAPTRCSGRYSTCTLYQTRKNISPFTVAIPGSAFCTDDGGLRSAFVHGSSICSVHIYKPVPLTLLATPQIDFDTLTAPIEKENKYDNADGW